METIFAKVPKSSNSTLVYLLKAADSVACLEVFGLNAEHLKLLRKLIKKPNKFPQPCLKYLWEIEWNESNISLIMFLTNLNKHIDLLKGKGENNFECNWNFIKFLSNFAPWNVKQAAIRALKNREEPRIKTAGRPRRKTYII